MKLFVCLAGFLVVNEIFFYAELATVGERVKWHLGDIGNIIFWVSLFFVWESGKKGEK